MVRFIVLDLEGFAAKYPKALVRIDAIKADGNDVKFDANKFFYGDPRSLRATTGIEWFNIWGSGTSCWTAIHSHSELRMEVLVTAGEPALAFNKTLEVTFTVVSNNK